MVLIFSVALFILIRDSFKLWPVGPIFGNAFHDFLANSIVENDAVSFAGNFAPFTTDFGSWFRVDPLGLNHLDTDVTLAFPSLNLTQHPHYDGFTTNFANSNALFLSTFFAALQKMSQLGVGVTLSQATSCILPCSGTEFAGKLLQCAR